MNALKAFEVSLMKLFWGWADITEVYILITFPVNINCLRLNPSRFLSSFGTLLWCIYRSSSSLTWFVKTKQLKVPLWWLISKKAFQGYHQGLELLKHFKITPISPFSLLYLTILSEAKEKKMFPKMLDLYGLFGHIYYDIPSGYAIQCPTAFNV